jgi:hypothetical protein
VAALRKADEAAEFDSSAAMQAACSAGTLEHRATIRPEANLLAATDIIFLMAFRVHKNCCAFLMENDQRVRPSKNSATIHR